MPSINLIWEQRLVRQRNQRIVAGLLAVVALAVLVIGEEFWRTRVEGKRCDAKIAECQATIQKNEERAKENRRLQAEIAILEPTLELLQGAQRINLRWVQLLSELDQAVPDVREVSLNQLGFVASVDQGASATTTGSTIPPNLLVGSLTLSGTARDYEFVTATMRRLARQPHIADVRLTQASSEGAGESEGRQPVVRFSIRAQFRIPEDEEKVLAVTTEEPKEQDYSEMLQKAGEKTILHRVPENVPGAQW